MSRRKAQPNSVPVKNPGHCYDAKKTRHSTRKSALGAAHLSANASNKPIRIYKCEWCRDWHLTKRVNPNDSAINVYPTPGPINTAGL